MRSETPSACLSPPASSPTSTCAPIALERRRGAGPGVLAPRSGHQRDSPRAGAAMLDQPDGVDRAGGARSARRRQAAGARQMAAASRGCASACARSPARSSAAATAARACSITLPRGRAATGARVVIKVLIAEDQAMVLGALAALIDIEPDLEVVAQAPSGSEALKAALTLRAGRRRHRHRDARPVRARAGRRNCGSAAAPRA